MGGFWRNTGVMLGGSWTNDGGMLERYKEGNVEGFWRGSRGMTPSQ